MSSESTFERAVISPALLQKIDLNKPLNPEFDLGMSKWISPEYDAAVKWSRANKENEEPPSKKPKLSLTLKKKSSDRFSTDEFKEAAKGVIPNNTKSSNEWAMRNLAAWSENRNSILPDDPVPKDLLSCTGAAVVCKWLCCYVQETKKENGLPYPATTLRSLLAALQCVLHSNKVPFNIFNKFDMRFRYLHTTLDTVCVSLSKEGIGAEVKHAAVVSLEHEI